MSQILARFVPHRGLTAGMFAGLVLFAIAAVLALMNADAADLGEGVTIVRISLWTIVVLCPVFAIDQFFRLVRGSPTLVATSDGIVMRSILGFTDPIPWAEIDEFAPVVISKKLCLGIFLTDPRRTLADYSMMMRFMHVRAHDPGEANIAYRWIHLGRSPVEAAEVLQPILEQQKGTRQKNSL
ncbi:MAG: hypothetical protein OEN23_20505 [Paracoccaceae bacterium]|nr:hypothetical protein [Paracoccaceae bacterium]